MAIKYVFKDSKTADTVAKALLFVAKFSKKQTLVKFSNSSVSVIWAGALNTYFIHTEATALDMFKNRSLLRKLNVTGGIDHFTIVQVEPSALGKTLKGNSHDRNVSITIIKATTHTPSRIRVEVEHTVESSKRVITHTLPCEIKNLEDYNAMLIEEVEKTYCRYDTKSYVDNIHRFKHIVESFVKLNTQRIYIHSKESSHGNDLIINTRTQGSSVHVNLSELENGHANLDEDEDLGRRKEAGVNIDTKKLAFFLSGLFAYKKTKVCFQIEHNKCLKLSLDNEVLKGEKFHQSLMLLHSLNNNS